MTHEEHCERHVLLHQALDELSADFLTHNPGRLPSATSLMDLMSWSNRQTSEPASGEHAPVGTRIVVRRYTGEDAGPETIICPRCGASSCNPHDVANRYCGACHAFHDPR